MRIAIIGGGFSGAVAAYHILKRAISDTRITIYEPSPDLGRGVAYADGPDHFLLNVPADSLLIDTQEANSFEQWAKSTIAQPCRYLEPSGSYFFPRSLFGRFVESLLADAKAGNARALLEHKQVAALGIEEASTGLGVASNAGTHVYDAVIVAIGNAPPSPLHASPATASSITMVQSAWDVARTPIGRDARVVIVGSGLTTADVIADLVARDHRGSIVCISRNGRRPHVSLGRLPEFSAQDRGATSARELVQQVRQWARRSTEELGDWRPAIDHVRRNAPHLWRGLPPAEQQRLRRHARALWEVHRYLMPPASHRLIQRLILEGRFTHLKGRVTSVSESGVNVLEGLQRTTVAADVVINASGFDATYRTSAAKLANLIEITGVPSALVERYGLAVDDHGSIRGMPSRFTGKLFALGYLARANHGELGTVNAIAEVAENIAVRLVATTRLTAPASSRAVPER